MCKRIFRFEFQLALKDKMSTFKEFGRNFTFSQKSQFFKVLSDFVRLSASTI